MDQETYETIRDSWWPFIIAGIIGTITFIRNYVGGPECPCNDKITNKIVVITGASSGLGLQIAKELAKRGAKLIFACRNLDKGNEAIKIIKLTVPNAEIDLKQLDLSSINSIKEFVNTLNEYQVIDILINNAGIMFHPYEITSDGYEIHFVTNYLGHFMLTHLLLPKLKASENGRVINIAAQAYSSGFINLKDLNLKNCGDNSTIKGFTQSKLAIVLMSRYMAKILQGTNVTINSMDPGLMRNTNHMNRSPLKTSIPVQLSVWPWMWLFLKTPKQGSQTVIYMAVDPKLSTTSGKHFCNCEIKELDQNCKNENIDKELYNISCTMLKIQTLDKLQ